MRNLVVRIDDISRSKGTKIQTIADNQNFDCMTFVWKSYRCVHVNELQLIQAKVVPLLILPMSGIFHSSSRYNF